MVRSRLINTESVLKLMIKLGSAVLNTESVLKLMIKLGSRDERKHSLLTQQLNVS